MIRAVWESGATRPFDFLVRNPRAVARAERWSIAQAQHILVVVEEARDRMVRLGVPPDRITVVSNTPSRNRVTELANLEARASRGEAGILQVVYLGLLEAPRGISVLLDAVGKCQAAGVRVQARIIGDGRERGDFVRRARELGLEAPVVEFLGYVPYEKAVRLLAAADVGIVPHFANDSWNSTIPNKLFDYMAAGIPVLTSDAKPASRIVRSAHCGEVFPDRDATALAAALVRLCDVALRQRYAEAGQRAVLAQYNWETDAARLVSAMEGVRARYPKG
jgi:glycosyltransferase involved in cell wall biosynthesis